jgi:hypothetical protein
MADIPSDVAQVLKHNSASSFFGMEEDRLKCQLNGHCFPIYQIQAIEAFVRYALTMYRVGILLDV